MQQEGNQPARVDLTGENWRYGEFFYKCGWKNYGITNTYQILIWLKFHERDQEFNQASEINKLLN